MVLFLCLLKNEIIPQLDPSISVGHRDTIR